MAAENRKSLLTLPQSGRDITIMIFRTSLSWKTCKSKIIDTALQSGVRSLFFGSSCIYPKLATTAKRRVFIDGYFGTN
jgi:hypothetical protein